jgi:hypothetical protein
MPVRPIARGSFQVGQQEHVPRSPFEVPSPFRP